MAATERDAASPLQALMTAALALPILVAPTRVAAEGNEIGFSVLGYKERGLMKVTEPVLWGRGTIAEVWDVEASAAVDIVTGASPRFVSNANGAPVQTISGASINDRRNTQDVKVTRHIGDFSIGASRTLSDEHDYNSKAYGIEAKLDLNQKNTTLVAGYGKSNDRVGSHDDPNLHEPRYTKEYLVGITQVLSPLDLIQSTVSGARGEGDYNDPYKFTVTFYPDGSALAAPDTRPDHRNTVSWLTRYRHFFPDANGSLQADYRYYHDDWGITAHTIEVGWQQPLGDRWEVRPGLRYYTQNAADFYSPLIPQQQPAVLSSDQRLGSWGGLSPTMRVVAHLDHDWRIEGTLGYVQNSASFHWGGSGSPAFSTLRAVYGILGISRPF
ncbi:MAG: DUF3570 domain-containing protein [Usitatibacter sp.]